MKHNPDEKKKPVFMSVAELAERWGYSKSKVRQVLDNSTIPVLMISRDVRIKLSDVEAYERAMTFDPGDPGLKKL